MPEQEDASTPGVERPWWAVPREAPQPCFEYLSQGLRRPGPPRSAGHGLMSASFRAARRSARSDVTARRTSPRPLAPTGRRAPARADRTWVISAWLSPPRPPDMPTQTIAGSCFKSSTPQAALRMLNRPNQQEGRVCERPPARERWFRHKMHTTRQTNFNKGRDLAQLYGTCKKTSALHTTYMSVPRNQPGLVSKKGCFIFPHGRDAIGSRNCNKHEKYQRNIAKHCARTRAKKRLRLL